MTSLLLRRTLSPATCVATGTLGLLLGSAAWIRLASCRHARTRGYTHLVVVSQTFHLPRAIALARACGIDAIGVGDDTFRHAGGEWARGEIRERFAALKAVTDVVTHPVRLRHNAPEARNASHTDT